MHLVMLFANVPDVLNFNATYTSGVVALSWRQPPEWVGVNDWIYVLQPGENGRSRSQFIYLIKNHKADVVVTDYSYDGSDSARWTAEEVAEMKAGNSTQPYGTKKKLIAYISIGEAEDYRFYWNNEWNDDGNANLPDNDWYAGEPNESTTPRWLGTTNPDWEGNFKVRYWYEDWWTTAIQPYLDRIIAQGFDGIYMDIIDAAEYWSDSNNYDLQNKAASAPDSEFLLDYDDACKKMVDFVYRIATYCRENSPYGNNFAIIQQNFEDIRNYVGYNSDGLSMIQIVNGIGREEVWYSWDTSRSRPIATGPDEPSYVLNGLRDYHGAAQGQPWDLGLGLVMVVDYRREDAASYDNTEVQNSYSWGYDSSNNFMMYFSEIDLKDINDWSSLTGYPDNNDFGTWAGVRIVRKVGSAPSSPTDGDVIYEGSGVSFTDTDPPSSGVVYYTAFSYNSDKSEWSSGVTLYVNMDTGEVVPPSSGGSGSESSEDSSSPSGTTPSFGVFPNRVSFSATSVSFKVPSKGDVKIYDVNGNLVASLENVSPPEGEWDLKDKFGRKIERGLYIAVFLPSDGSGRQIFRFIVK